MLYCLVTLDSRILPGNIVAAFVSRINLCAIVLTALLPKCSIDLVYHGIPKVL